MTARIIHIEHWDRDDLFVPGTDPKQIVADGNMYLDREKNEFGEDAIVVTAPGQIRIGWYRVNPCKPGINCGDEHIGHWAETEGKTRGGFQGAMVTIGTKGDLR